jgi:chromosome segregation ATPase
VFETGISPGVVAMTADDQRTHSPPIPLETISGTGGLGEDDMTSFISTHIESILKPYAENVIELHKTVLDLSSSVCVLQEKCDLYEPYAARMDGIDKELEKLMQFAQSTREFLDGFIDESAQKDKKAKAQVCLKDTLTMIKDDVEAKAIEALKEADVEIHRELDELRKNGEDMRTKLVDLQDAEKENRGNCVQLKSELERVAENLKCTDEAHADTIKKVDTHKGHLDTETMQNKEMSQEQRYLRAKFIAISDEWPDKLKKVDEQVTESRSQLKQYRKEFEQTRDATSQSLVSIKDELGVVNKETQARLDKLDSDLMSQVRSLDKKGKDMDSNLSNQIRNQSQQQKDDMKDVRRSLGDLEATSMKHDKEVAALQKETKVLPGRINGLREDAVLSSKRHERVENVLGLEPLTKEDVDPNRGLKQRASSALLSDDQLQRKAWTAWMEFMRDAKQNQVVNALPNIQDMLKIHQSLIESEKSKLHSTSDRVQSLEVDHTKLTEDLQKLRKSLELNDGYWKGMTRGLQVAKTTMHTEGDGGMVPSATRLRNALPPLTGLATPRPNTTQSTLRPHTSSITASSEPAAALN